MPAPVRSARLAEIVGMRTDRVPIWERHPPMCRCESPAGQSALKLAWVYEPGPDTRPGPLTLAHPIDRQFQCSPDSTNLEVSPYRVFGRGPRPPHVAHRSIGWLSKCPKDAGRVDDYCGALRPAPTSPRLRCSQGVGLPPWVFGHEEPPLAWATALDALESEISALQLCEPEQDPQPDTKTWLSSWKKKG